MTSARQRDAPVRRISVPVDGRVPTGSTNAYLVGGDPALLVDPPARTDDLDAAVADGTVDHIAVTHAHPDHIGGVESYAAETGATVWCRRGREDRFARAAGIRPDRTFVEGSELPIGDGVSVIDVPGHAPDHVAFETASGTLCGDVAVAEGSVAVAAPEGDIRAYLVALRRLYARNPPQLFPGHGPAIADTRATCERLIRHRLDREQRVLDAVRSGATSVDAVLDAAYDADLTGVRDLARATVVAHLEKLDVENSVVFDRTAETVEAR
ncbi:MBL fold metallo-hydrolase [Halobellus inordinatus]|uniref:MBL fold metallo-hydrolase n=1 Tax=Halobellus inordinatus TaxID=1126236 RepID=UPI0021149EA4|nr:MBL fold metallo-hydrolase [Halobellus ramosii]